MAVFRKLKKNQKSRINKRRAKMIKRLGVEEVEALESLTELKNSMQSLKNNAIPEFANDKDIALENRLNGIINRLIRAEDRIRSGQELDDQDDIDFLLTTVSDVETLLSEAADIVIDDNIVITKDENKENENDK